jgi:acyl-CoA thioester hydrolase
MHKKVFSPRISEVNGAGHIGHNVIPVWLEEGLIEIIRIFDPNLKGEESLLVLTNSNINFLQPMFLGEDVELITGVRKIGNTSLVLNQEIYQGGKLCVRGKTSYVHFSPKSQKSTPISLAARQELEEHLMED